MFAEKASLIAQNGGAGVAIVSGAELILGFTPGEWSVIGVAGGLLIGLVGLVANIYFQARKSP
jgi:hypothetical protein